ncbi:hypothetical protein V1289_007133 [Bradyrhizobium sp. AZCC 2289]
MDISGILDRPVKPGDDGRGGTDLSTSLRAQRSNPSVGNESVDCFVATLLAMTVLKSQIRFPDPAARSARGRFRPKRRGRRKCRGRAAPAVSCAKLCEETHTSIQVQRRHPGIPCAMVLRLMPRSPRRRIRLVTVIGGLTILPSPVGPAKFSTDLTPATGARTTRFCRTQQPVFAKRLAGLWRRRLARCCPLTRELALRTHTRRRCRVHRIPSRIRDDRDTPLLPGKDGASW